MSQGLLSKLLAVSMNTRSNSRGSELEFHLTGCISLGISFHTSEPSFLIFESR